MFAKEIIWESCLQTECSSSYELKWLLELSQAACPEAKKKLANDEKQNLLLCSPVLLQSTASCVTSLQCQVANARAWHWSDCLYVTVGLLPDLHVHLQVRCHCISGSTSLAQFSYLQKGIGGTFGWLDTCKVISRDPSVQELKSYIFWAIFILSLFLLSYFGCPVKIWDPWPNTIVYLFICSSIQLLSTQWALILTLVRWELT